MTPSPEAGEPTPERLSELTRIAEAVNHGPWSEDADKVVDDRAAYGGIVCMAPDAECIGSLEHWSTRRAHVATFDPPTVIALIATLQGAQARLEKLTAERDAALRECSDWARKAGMAIGELKASLWPGVIREWREAKELAEQEASRWKAEAEKAVEALKPFAVEYDEWWAEKGRQPAPRSGEDDLAFDDNSKITVGDLRRARALTSLRGDAT